MRINDSSRSIRHLLNLFVRVPRRSKKSLYHKYWCGYIVYNEYSNTLGVSPQRTIYKSQLNTLSGWNSSLQGQFSNLLEYIMEWRIISLSEEFIVFFFLVSVPKQQITTYANVLHSRPSLLEYQYSSEKSFVCVLFAMVVTKYCSFN